MKKFFLLSVIAFLFLTGCCKYESSYNSSYSYERPHLYWKTVECEITDITYYGSWCIYHHVGVTIYNKEYNISKTFNLIYDEGQTFAHEGFKEGDHIFCTLYTQKYDSSGEIINRWLDDLIIERE